MPTVRILTAVASPSFSHRRGEEVRVSAAEAKSWIALGIAELVTRDEPETPEATKRRRSGRPETRNIETR